MYKISSTQVFDVSLISRTHIKVEREPSSQCCPLATVRAPSHAPTSCTFSHSNNKLTTLLIFYSGDYPCFSRHADLPNSNRNSSLKSAYSILGLFQPKVPKPSTFPCKPAPKTSQPRCQVYHSNL